MLTDEFGNKVIPFTVSIEVEEENVPVENLEEPLEDTENPQEVLIVDKPDEGVLEEGNAEGNPQVEDISLPK